MLARSTLLPTLLVLHTVTGLPTAPAPNPTACVASVVPQDASPLIDIDFPGFAFEEAGFYLYATDANGDPNQFSLALIQNVLKRTGGTPILRVGGTSGDEARYNATQEQPAIPNGLSNPPLWHLPFLSIGPKFFTAYRNLPGCQFVVMIPLLQQNITNSLEWAGQAFANIPEGALEAVEIGNEPDLYKNLTTAAYTRQWLNYQEQLVSRFPSLGAKPSFQGLDYANDNGAVEAIPETFKAGVNQTGQIKQVSYHYYESVNRILHNLTDLQLHIVNHTRVKNHLHNYTSDIHSLQQTAPGTRFILGENGNSIPLNNQSATTQFSNVLGTALWNVDFQLQAMTIGVNRVNMQQVYYPGYSMWQPQSGGALPAGVHANYYSQPMVGDFIGTSNKTRVVELDLSPLPDKALMAGYAAYDGPALARIALINMQLWSADESATPRPLARITLTGLPDGCVTARWLNAPEGAYANDTLTYGGQQWQYPSGQPVQVIDDTTSVLVDHGELVVLLDATAAVLLTVGEVCGE